MKILLLGAAGFIGTNLTIELAKKTEDEITLVDRSKAFFKPIVSMDLKNVHILEADLTVDMDFDSILKDQEVVYHLVSTTVPTTSNQHISQELVSNVIFSANLFEACIRCGVKKVVFVSSGGTVYGKEVDCPLKEKTATNPISSYGVQKITIEKLLYLYFDLTEHVYTYPEDFKKYPIDADIFCTGSDQVWNTGWNGGIIKSLFLDFIPDKKFRFAYAASFGKKTLAENEVKETKELIAKYNFISVREDYAKTMLQDYYGYKNAVHVVDPTLAYDGNFWRKYAPKSKIKGDYILIYNLNRSKEFDDYAIELSKRTGLPIYFLCRRYDQFVRPGKSILVPEVFEFITLIDNAKYVLTDSFHATAFSLNLNTEPICIYPSEYGGRLESILRMTDTLQRHVENYQDFDVINRSVDFEKVNTIFDEQRKKTRKFLSKVFETYQTGNMES